MNKKYIIGGLVLIVVAVVVFVSLGSENMTYYQTPTEILGDVKKYEGKMIRVMGLVEAGSIQWEPKGTKLSFRITEDSKLFLTVNHIGTKPDMFKEGQGVVVEGKLLADKTFKASKLLVKHSEEYTVDEKDHSKRKADYYKKSVAE